ncbi:MAG TPA: hypothetical protein VGD37_09440 [Kofleriaceae bacterium]|jgi:hypothetical protein
MLDPWIIEEILKKEEEQRRESERGRIELPIERRDRGDRPAVTPPREEGERGVVIIDI